MQKIFILCLLLAATAVVQAQQNGISFSVTAGFDRGGLTGRGVDSFSTGGAAKSGNGWSLGVSLNNNTGRHFGLKHEIFYSRRAMSIQLHDDAGMVYDSRFRRQYIDLFPISPIFYTRGLQVFAGPYIGWLLSASVERKDANGHVHTDKSFYGDATAAGPYSQKFDAGLMAGVAYELPVGLQFGVRWVRGFVPVVENSAGRDQWRIYNQTLMFTVGYRIH